MPLILEDEGKRFGGRQIILPQYVVDHLKERQNLYSGDEYKTSKGYKRLNAILSKDYNNPSDRKDRQNNNAYTISFADAKRIDFDMKHMPQNKGNVEYDMIGGDVMRDFLHNNLTALRNSVSKVKKVPEVPKLSTKDIKPEAPNKEIKVGKVNVTLESKLFNNLMRKLYK
jgi:hypothetical protein